MNNRSIRVKSQNKVGHHDPIMGHSQITQRSFLYNAVKIYNGLPRNLTLIKERHLFKKWSKKYNLNNKIILKEQDDNIKEYIQQIINQDQINLCQEYYT